MCSLAMSFLFAYYPLLLLWLSAYSLCLVCLYFVPGRGCSIAANLVLSLITAARTATMATSTALRKISIGMAPVVAALSFLLYVLWYICTILWQVLLLSVAAIILAIHALSSAVHDIAVHCRDLLWLFALFISVAAIGARFLTAMCLGFGLLWNIPLIGNYVDPAMAFCLLFLL